jgi:hypothetical protein
MSNLTPKPNNVTKFPDELWADDVEKAKTNENIDEKWSFPDSIGDEENATEIEHTEEDAPVKKKGKNYPLLAASGAIGLALLAGVGWMVMDQLSAPTSKKAQPIEILAASAPTPPVASVFDKSDKTPDTALPVVPATVPVAPVPVVGATLAATALPTTTAGAASVPVSASVAAVATTPVVATNPASKTSAAPAALAKPDPIKAVEAPKEATKEITELTAPAVKLVKAPKAKRVTTHTDHKRRVTQDTKVQSQELLQPTEAHQAQPAKTEMLMLPKGLKVTSIYPQAGMNAQAWLTDGSGRLEIVRAGDTLMNGIEIIKITPETGEVFTSAGVITSKGASK